jgi:DNA-binding MarR family transcriptional regulator
MSDAAERAWGAMRTLVLELSDRRAQVAAALGMSFVRVRALRRLARSPMTMRDLATALSIDRPYTTVVIDDLEARGLVARRPDGDDRRRKIVAVTAEGRRLAREAEAILNVPPPQLTALPAEDLAALDRILEAVVAAGVPR